MSKLMSKEEFIAENLYCFMNKHNEYINSIVTLLIEDTDKSSCEWNKTFNITETSKNK